MARLPRSPGRLRTPTLAAVAAGTALIVTAALLPWSAPRAAEAVPPSPPGAAVVSEADRVDAVPTPRLGWYPCYGYAECATADLPLDYDQPAGPTTEVALLRVRARDASRRVGSLFVNPGGPSGSGTALAYFSRFIYGAEVLDRFDIVGVDPRGTNFSDTVGCFPGHRQQQAFFDALPPVAFPFTRAEEQGTIRAYGSLGRACSTTGRPLSLSMSTAQVARDLDVLRRAVGDRQLSYFGFSYGSYLGQVYANLFPGRVRAVAIDGVLDPVGWAGTAATARIPMGDRIRSADGSYKALAEILRRCDRAGPTRCTLARGGALASYDRIAERLKREPLTEVDPVTGEEVVVLTYADFVGLTLSLLYDPAGWTVIEAVTEDVQAASGLATARSSAAQRRSAVARVKAQKARVDALDGGPTAPGRFGFPYEWGLDAFSTISCTDSVNPPNLAAWPAYGAAADRRARYFGRLWTWNQAMCASATFRGRDEDAYRGPFTRNTARPVLVVGNFWDPATNYAGAVTADRLLPNSRLLRSDSFGHTAYGSSACVTDTIDAYLVSLAVPSQGKLCRGDIQPFEPLPGADPQRGRTALVKLARLAQGSPLR